MDKNQRTKLRPLECEVMVTCKIMVTFTFFGGFAQESEDRMLDGIDHGDQDQPSGIGLMTTPRVATDIT